jgi:hypothetical protein
VPRSHAHTCNAGDCQHRVARGGLCFRHLQQLQEGRLEVTAARTRHASPWDMLAEAALRYADASTGDDEEYERASARLRMASLRYARREGAEPGPSAR